MTASPRNNNPLALTRLSRWTHLAPDSLSLVREELATSLGFTSTATNSGTRDKTLIDLGDSTFGNFSEQPTEAQLGAKIRRLVSSGAPWPVLSELLWQRFNNGRTPQKAAQLLETAFVQAQPSETLEIFSHIIASGLKEFYWHVHPKLRDFLVEHSPEVNLDQLYWIIAREKDEAKLSGIEQTYIFLRVTTTSDKTAAWEYFRRNQNKILESFGTSNHFGMTQQQMIYRVGKLALSLGYLEESRILFRLLTNNSSDKAALTIAANGSLSTPTAVANYHSQCTDLPPKLLRVTAKKTDAVTSSTIAAEPSIKIDSSKPLTNSELLDFWRSAVKNTSPDLAWRIATVLASRDALPSEIKPSWEISGEHRAAYAPLPISQKEIECALSTLAPATKLVVQALCTLGTKLNEYALIYGDASHTSPSESGTSTIEQTIAKIVKNSLDIPKATKNVFEPSGIHVIPSVAAPLAQAMANVPWLFACHILAERFSLPSWGWNVSELQIQLKKILPLIGKAPSWRTHLKLMKWIASMNSSERTAWSTLARATKDESLEQLSTELVNFICRLALILYPSHLTALKALQQSRVSLDVLRDLESFILSDSWTTLRIHHKIGAKVLIPQSLR